VNSDTRKIIGNRMADNGAHDALKPPVRGAVTLQA
jgi:hypothetical protein